MYTCLNGLAMHSNFNDLKKRGTMTDNEIKEDCLQEAGIDLGRYSHSELIEIKNGLSRYHEAKLKLLGIGVVTHSKPTYKTKNQLPDGWKVYKCTDCQEINAKKTIDE